MKKVVVPLVIVVVAIVVGYLVNLQLKTVSIVEGQEIDVDDIHHLSIQTTATDIELIPSSSNQVTVSLDGEIKSGTNDTYQLEIEEDRKQQKLTISYVTNTKGFRWSLGSEENVTLQVALPERAYKEFEITTTSGDIHIQSIEAEEMKVHSTSGDQSIEESLVTGTLSLQATSGDISLSANTFHHFTIETTSGDVHHRNFKSKNGSIHTTSGDVSVLLEEMIPSLRTNSTSGDVSIQFGKEPESLDLIFTTNSGEADVNLENMIFDEGSERKVGRIGKGENHLLIQTTSGDLTVE
jgi:lia operon protein LiaG